MKLRNKLTQIVKSYFKLTHIHILIVVMITQSCSEKDEVLPFNATPGNGEFYRITQFGKVSVIPEKRQVRVLIRVTDSSYFGAPDLEKENFEVLENNIDKVNDIEAKTKIDPRSIPYKIKTVLLLDISSSVEGKVSDIKKAVNELIDVKPAGQEFAIYTFDSKVKLVQDFTSETFTLREAINSIPESGLDASTNLYKAIIDAGKAWQDKITMERIEEGSMIVFTDGKHNADPGLNEADVIRAIEDKAIYIAALDAPNLDEVTLKKIAGNDKRYLLAEDISGLSEVFQQIQDKIIVQSKSIYYITYTSPISVPGRQNLKILLKDNSNPYHDYMVETSFSTNGF